jgi:hypothetical protein
MQHEDIAIRNPVVALPFAQVDVPDAAGVYDTLAGASGAYVMPWAGWVIAMSVRHNADLAGGTITHRILVNGTANTTYTLVTDDTHQQAYSEFKDEAIPFAAGDYLGMDFTKSGTVDPTTTDVDAVLFVRYRGVGPQ